MKNLKHECMAKIFTKALKLMVKSEPVQTLWTWQRAGKPAVLDLSGCISWLRCPLKAHGHVQDPLWPFRGSCQKELWLHWSTVPIWLYSRVRVEWVWAPSQSTYIIHSFAIYYLHNLDCLLSMGNKIYRNNYPMC